MIPRGGKHFNAFTTKYSGRASALTGFVSIRAAADSAGPDAKTDYPADEFRAVWDTGATGCVITQRVIDVCGLKPIGMTKISHADGQSISEVFLVDLRLPHNTLQFTNAKVTKGKLKDIDVLIGMDVITLGDFAVTNADGKTTFSFRVPSVATVDYVEVAHALDPKAKSPAAVGRNDPCPCGSGRKYKKCCGAIAANRH